MPPAHPSSRPYGRNPRRRGARPAASDRLRWTDAEPLSCVAQPGKRIIAVEPPGTRRARVVRCIRPIARAASTVCASGRHWWTDAEPYHASRSRGRESSQWNRPERAGRGWYVRWYAASVQLPGRRTRFAASGRPQWTDAEPYRASRSRERESTQWNRPERAGRGWYVASVRLPGRGARLAASDRSQWTDAKPFREPRSRKSEGYARRCFTSPAHPSNCPGGERGLRLQTVIGGRRRSLCHASRGRGKKSQRWNRPDAPGARDT